MHQNGWHAAAVYTVVVLAAAADFEVVIVDTTLHALNVVLDIRAGELRILTRRFLQGQPARPCQLHTGTHTPAHSSHLPGHGPTAGLGICSNWAPRTSAQHGGRSPWHVLQWR